ncbi:DUF1932 domain-containing protein [Streptomyces sp. URMC 129]
MLLVTTNGAVEPAPDEAGLARRPIGLLHPGAMGAVIGAQLVHTGRTVLWAGAGRSETTRRRAEAAGLQARSGTADLAHCSVIFSVCPPAAALEVAAAVAGSGFDGLYVEANAISPQHAQEIAALLGGRGATVVDGGIVGPPPREPDTTRIYLSGPDDAVGRIDRMFATTTLRPVALTGPVGRASALKLAFATYNKLSHVLAAQAHALADSHGLSDELGELAEAMLPGTPLARPGGLVGAGRSAWRWEGEMNEIAAACTDAAIPPEVLRAAGTFLARWRVCKDDESLTVDRLLAALRDA